MTNIEEKLKNLEKFSWIEVSSGCCQSIDDDAEARRFCKVIRENKLHECESFFILNDDIKFEEMLWGFFIARIESIARLILI